jgi:signal peptidase I
VDQRKPGVAEKPAQPPPPEREKVTDVSRGFVAEWTVTIILLLFGTTTLVQAFVIPTGSMEDTLLIGDHLLVDKMAYAPAGSVTKHLLPYDEVERGDIIVFRYPGDIRQTYVKRVVGIPGDRIHLVNKQVYRNGRPLDEPYKYHKTDYIDSYRDNFPGDPNVHLYEAAQTMLEKHVDWGVVPRENIIGKPLIIYWSYDAPTERLANPTIGLDHLLDLVQNFFTKTRWSRTFMLIRGHSFQN